MQSRFTEEGQWGQKEVQKMSKTKQNPKPKTTTTTTPNSFALQSQTVTREGRGAQGVLKEQLKVMVPGRSGSRKQP